MAYRTRVADAEVAQRLIATGAVLIEGPKSCGKTETARRVAASEVLFDIDPAARSAVEISPESVLNGPAPLLLDEWQLAPSVWDRVRREVDSRQKPGQFILTGSSVPDHDVRRHSGAGRIGIVRMRTMSLVESGESIGTVSLRALLAGDEQASAESGMKVQTLAVALCRGGWPSLIDTESAMASAALGDYILHTCHVDVLSVAGPRRDPTKVGRVFQSLARLTATDAPLQTIAADVHQSGGSIDRHSVADYVDALERLMLVENQPAWSPRLRSRAVVRVSPKRHFVDPSLAAAAMGASPEKLLRDPETLGLLFESLVVRDLRVLSAPLRGTVHHYRDNVGFEIDAIVQCPDGRWGAFEVKLGHLRVDAAAAQLLKFRQRVDTSIVGEPAVLGVITVGGPAYRRPDGVHVIPIDCLGA
ncbi:MAG: ATP-binding protein [Actinobacteria bacterium]|jgi:hypothetical protein|nr:ATP-binding protein [Actinomycetota bacterium]